VPVPPPVATVSVAQLVDILKGATDLEQKRAAIKLLS
jgi:hypothetical protein